MQQLLTAGAERLQELQTLFAPTVDWLKEWQFLLGSVVALFAGMIIVKAINRQSMRQSVESKEERRRRVRALRTAMPAELQAICSYARRSADVGREAFLIVKASEEELQSPANKGRQNRLKCPTLPASVPSNLKALIENLDDLTAEQVVALLRCFYTQHTRLAEALEDFNRSSTSKLADSKTLNLNPIIKDTLELYLRANGMLQFAKGESENIAGTFTAVEVINALQVLNIDNIISPEGREHCVKFLAKTSQGPALGLGGILSRRQRKTSRGNT